MERSVRKYQRNKKVNEVITFPVPFTLEDIKESISIFTNTPYQLSIEQLIKQAMELHSNGNISKAAKCYENLINHGLKNYIIFSNYGTILKNLGNLEEAELFTRKAISLNPNYANAHLNLGNIFKSLGKSKEAELSTRKAIELKPNFAEAHSNLGIILKDQGDLNEAEKSYRKAIKIKPDFADAYSNLGNVMRDLGNLKEAEKLYLKAIKIKPDFADAYYNLGNILKDRRNLREAIDYYKKAINLNNNFSLAKSSLIESKGLICDWSDQKYQKIWLEKLGIKGSAVNPISLFYYEDNPLKHLKRSQKFYQEYYYHEPSNLASHNNKKIHIGYFSSDFKKHATMYLIASILELHDKSEFIIYLYSFTRYEDEFTERAKKSGCFYRNISKLNNDEIIKLAREDKLDIAIDLKGYTKESRMGIFSNRVAPIQINYLGYPGSLGADNIDYIIADNIIIPKEYEKFYSEKVIRMPSCYQCNDDTKEISKKPISRTDFNLPKKGFVFTCFNANKKITPQEFDIWMRLLNKVKNSVLWIYQSNKYSAENLINEAKIRNIDQGRLIFANSLPLKEHLARHALGDLALDTFNYNGHTTTSDALWSGLPVLTKIGESFAARVSASLLTSIGLPELITYSEKEYEEKALNLASNPNKIKKIKSKLVRLKDKSPLYDSKFFTKNLEYKFKELMKINN